MVLPFFGEDGTRIESESNPKYYSYNNKESSIDMSKSHQINGDRYPSPHAPTDLPSKSVADMIIRRMYGV